MMNVMVPNQSHFLLIAFPVHGHINPTLQFANQLLRLGVKVTFAVTISAYRRMIKDGQHLECLNFVVFSDGFDNGCNFSNHNDTKNLHSQFRNQGTQCLKETILSSADKGSPITCLVYTIPWAVEVARELNVPFVLLWIQPASMFRICYYYFNGYDKLVGDSDTCNEVLWSVELPGLPLLKIRDLPSPFLPPNIDDPSLDVFKQHIEVFSKVDKAKVLVNSFNTLEEKALKEIDNKIKMIAIGPLIPSGSNSCFGEDLFEKSKDYLEWMNTKAVGSIVYVSFGSLIILSKKQKEELGKGLLASGRPFLWVVRDKNDDMRPKGKAAEEKEEEISCMKELAELGITVPWCSQLEVLSHPSLGCFVSHCGWNSTLESIVCGVPVVAFPYWVDQPTNAKLVEDEWKTGVRVTANEDGIVEAEEIRRCVESVMGEHEKGVELRKNAKKWKDLASDAMNKNGSSYMNLKAFVEGVDGSSSD